MLETYLAHLESSPLFTPVDEQFLSRWTLHVEASCWLRSNTSDANDDVEFVIEYSDSLRNYSHIIDKASACYFQDCLLSGCFTLKGFGSLKAARLLVRSIGLDVNYKEASVNRPRYKLVA